MVCFITGSGGTGLTMIKLFSVKQKQKEAAESANGRAPVKKQSAGELRVQKGMLSHLSSACSLNKTVFVDGGFHGPMTGKFADRL